MFWRDPAVCCVKARGGEGAVPIAREKCRFRVGIGAPTAGSTQMRMDAAGARRVRRRKLRRPGQRCEDAREGGPERDSERGRGGGGGGGGGGGDEGVGVGGGGGVVV